MGRGSGGGGRGPKAGGGGGGKAAKSAKAGGGGPTPAAVPPARTPERQLDAQVAAAVRQMERVDHAIGPDAVMGRGKVPIPHLRNEVERLLGRAVPERDVWRSLVRLENRGRLRIVDLLDPSRFSDALRVRLIHHERSVAGAVERAKRIRPGGNKRS